MLTAYAQKLIAKNVAAPASGRSSPRRLAQASAAPAPDAAEPPLPPGLAARPLLMTVAEVAGRFGTSHNFILTFRETGELDFVNIGSGSTRPTYRITRASVADFERRRRPAPKP
ncbi:MAG TPA: helix-turn-helix domain-containing protein [Verrucomicrobiae bacterium]|jgi:hypothetical protein|nr:helix-turn-helix domain-containing protein [Verrucomicrobiae bacterium]